MLCLVAMQASAHAQDDAWSKRADHETRAVLQAVIADSAKTIRPCELSGKWLYDQRVSSEDARTYLGLNLYADVTAPFDGRDVAEILDPDNAMAQNFCDDETFRKKQDQLFEDFVAGRIEGEVPPHNRPGREVSRRRIAFGRPVFDAALETAAFIVTYETRSRRRDPEGAAKFPSAYLPNGIRKGDNLYAVGIRYIYRKRGTAWVKIDDEEIFRAE